MPMLWTVPNAIALGLMFRLGMAAWNGLWGPSFGAGPDAAGFHLWAVAYAGGSGWGDFQLSNIYIYALGTLYRWTIPSLFLGSLMSCAAWLASACLLGAMMNLLRLNKAQQFKAMIIYALLPSAIIITSVTLREAYQLFAVNFVVYLALKIYISGSLRSLKAYAPWLLFAGVALMGALHGVLLIAGLVISVMTFMLILFERSDPRYAIKLTVTFSLLVLIAYAASALFLALVFNANVGLGESVQIRQDSWQQSARASYSTGIRIKSDADLLVFVPVALFHYLFQPMPWRVSTMLDGSLLLENLLRGYLLCQALLGLYFSHADVRDRLKLVFVAYLVIESIWAVVTINWGTAVRHHVPAFGLLLLLAFSVPKETVPISPLKGVIDPAKR